MTSLRSRTNLMTRVKTKKVEIKKENKINLVAEVLRRCHTAVILRVSYKS